MRNLTLKESLLIKHTEAVARMTEIQEIQKDLAMHPDLIQLLPVMPLLSERFDKAHQDAEDARDGFNKLLRKVSTNPASRTYDSADIIPFEQRRG